MNNIKSLLLLILIFNNLFDLTAKSNETDNKPVFIKGIKFAQVYPKAKLSTGIEHQYYGTSNYKIKIFYGQAEEQYCAYNSKNEEQNLDVSWSVGYTTDIEISDLREKTTFLIGQYDFDNDKVDELILALQDNNVEDNGITINIFKLKNEKWVNIGTLTGKNILGEPIAEVKANAIIIKRNLKGFYYEWIYKNSAFIETEESEDGSRQEINTSGSEVVKTNTVFEKTSTTANVTYVDDFGNYNKDKKWKTIIDEYSLQSNYMAGKLKNRILLKYHLEPLSNSNISQTAFLYEIEMMEYGDLIIVGISYTTYEGLKRRKGEVLKNTIPKLTNGNYSLLLENNTDNFKSEIELIKDSQGIFSKVNSINIQCGNLYNFNSSFKIPVTISPVLK